MNRPLRQKEMPEEERPLSEQFRLVALAWCDADAAASLREELKTKRASAQDIVDAFIGEGTSNPRDTAKFALRRLLHKGVLKRTRRGIYELAG
jgi:hypothetical protein